MPVFSAALFHHRKKESIVVLLRDRLYQATLQAIILGCVLNAPACTLHRTLVKRRLVDDIGAAYDIVHNDGGARFRNVSHLVHVLPVVLFVRVNEDVVELWALAASHLRLDLWKSLQGWADDNLDLFTHSRLVDVATAYLGVVRINLKRGDLDVRAQRSDPDGCVAAQQANLQHVLCTRHATL